jgi:hypothetical protein
VGARRRRTRRARVRTSARIFFACVRLRLVCAPDERAAAAQTDGARARCALTTAGVAADARRSSRARAQAWYRSWNSPYYNASHHAFRAKVREFTEKEIMPYCHEWDEAKTLPKELFEKASAAGWLPVCVGAWPTVRAPRRRGRKGGGSAGRALRQRRAWVLTRARVARLPRAGVRGRAAGGAEEHGLLPRGEAPRDAGRRCGLWARSGAGQCQVAERDCARPQLVLIDELSRCGSGGVLWGLFGGLSIGAPAALSMDALQQRRCCNSGHPGAARARVKPERRVRACPGQVCRPS